MMAVALTAHAKDYDNQEMVGLMNALPNAKVSLAQGVRQAENKGEVATSAKFELNDEKKLSLSVYTAENGLTVDPEHNVLKELSGAPDQTVWSPQSEEFKDLPHVARASEHLTLMSVAKHGLADFIAMAEKQAKGTVFSAIPEIRDHRPILVVLIANTGKMNELQYDLQTGRVLAQK